MPARISSFANAARSPRPVPRARKTSPDRAPSRTPASSFDTGLAAPASPAISGPRSGAASSEREARSSTADVLGQADERVGAADIRRSCLVPADGAGVPECPWKQDGATWQHLPDRWR